MLNRITKIIQDRTLHGQERKYNVIGVPTDILLNLNPKRGRAAGQQGSNQGSGIVSIKQLKTALSKMEILAL